MKKGSKSYRLVIDSNIWISFLIGKGLRRLPYHIKNKTISVISCVEQIAELQEVFLKPKLRKYFTNEQIADFFELLEESTEIVIIKKISAFSRDPKDDYLISLAVESKADYLITGDKEILELELVKETKMISYVDFEKIMKG
jgi:hypothetical protein